MTQTLPRSFTALAWSNLAAQSAEQLSLAAVPIVAVMALNAGPGEVGLLATAQTLPFLLLSIPLGLLADRGSRKRLMVLAELVRDVRQVQVRYLDTEAAPPAWQAGWTATDRVPERLRASVSRGDRLRRTQPRPLQPLSRRSVRRFTHVEALCSGCWQGAHR